MDRKRMVVFAPHPDDETFGCGGTIAKRVSEGWEVFVVVMTDGRYAFLNVLGLSFDPSPEEVKKMRREEVKKAVNILGVPEGNLIFLDFVDGSLDENMGEAEDRVVEVLGRVLPDEVYFPYKGDGHPDHRAAYARFGPVVEAFFNLFRNRRVYVDVSEFLPLKERAIKEFRSELAAVSARQHRPVVSDTKKFLRDKELFYVDK